MSKIIALRESLSGGNDNTNPVQQRGEFTTNIDPYLTLNKGDSIGIKQAFLDTRSTTGDKIKIDSTNQNVTLQHFLYITDRFPAASRPVNFKFKDLQGAGITHPDGQRYIFSKKSGGQTQNLGFITEIQIPRSGIKQYVSPTSNPNFLNGFDVNFSYQAPDPQDHTKFVTKSATVGLASGVYTESIITFKMGNQKGAPTTFKIPMFDNGTGLKGCNITFDDGALKKDGITNTGLFNIQTETSVNATSIEPLPITYKFKLDEGNYSPDDLARTITDKLIIAKTVPSGNNTGVFTFTEDMNSVDTKFMFNNPYFTSIGQVTDAAEKVNWGNDVEDLPFFVREDGKSILNIDKTNGDSFFFGCSEMSLQFNDETQKFVFTQLHQPIFSDGANNTPVEVINSVVDVGTKKFLIGESGGVIFTNLDPSLRNFFKEDLGFDSSLFVTPQQGETNATFTDGAAQETQVNTFSVNLEMAVNATSGITGCDSAVVKGANFAKEQPVTQSAILNNFEIFADSSTSESHLTDGYFIIEIDGLPNSDVRGYSTGSIQAIVSRYYATADFVIMEGYSGSIPYVHESEEPLILSSLNVRILNADRSTVGQLGTNNSIFLEYTPSSNS